MSDSVRINGNLISWSSARLKIDVESYAGITAIEYGDSRERAHTYGMGRHHAPRAKTAGKYVPEPVVITCWESTAKAIRDDLAARSSTGRSFGEPSVPITLQYIEIGDDIITVEAQECTYVKTETSHEEGPEGLNKKITFMPMRYVYDGNVLYDDSRS